MVELIEFLVFLLEVIVTLIRWFWKMLVWIWGGLVWLLGPLGAGLGLTNLLLLPWFHSGAFLLTCAVVWMVWISARQMLLRHAIR
ncbi:hypothetical protein [Deinococcus cellulosilyticus]|uniref:Uncharacterized protein n=1 Tax=Deinococcus cellulosilyticus (strain DSM 18568 / NBRC 106333 / KACC 11606 / 5516J-15) TaxID=1223518 RepID=A0A511N4F9_DEIC1|nr:hypothetical protein [Deinococcus cellulosilyticus]GEM47722.1 hypothetical protein DC3_33570 [Deinococcus cellulosilyticus NBRC 106333 = KACC 11606]